MTDAFRPIASGQWALSDHHGQEDAEGAAIDDELPGGKTLEDTNRGLRGSVVGTGGVRPTAADMATSQSSQTEFPFDPEQ